MHQHEEYSAVSTAHTHHHDHNTMRSDTTSTFTPRAREQHTHHHEVHTSAIQQCSANVSPINHQLRAKHANEQNLHGETVRHLCPSLASQVSDSVASCAAAVRVHSHGVVLVTIRTREQLVRQHAVLGNFEVVRTGGMLRIPVCSWARRPRLCSENPASSQPLNPRVRAREWQCIRSNMLI